MRILQVLGNFLAYGQRECDIIARDMMRMNQRRQKTSWEHEEESFCNHIREFRTKVEYIPLAQSLCIIAVDLVWASYTWAIELKTPTDKLQLSATLGPVQHLCVWKTGDFQTFCFTDAWPQGKGATRTKAHLTIQPMSPWHSYRNCFLWFTVCKVGFVFLVICLAHCGLHYTNLNSHV